MNKTYKEHIVFWVVLLASFSIIPFFQEDNSSSLLALILQNVKRLPAMFVAAYAFNEILIPYYYRNKKYVLFAVLTIALFYLTAALDRFINVYVYEPLFREGHFEQESIGQILREYPYLISGYLPPILIATFAMNVEKVLREKQVAENRNASLERDKNMAELKALKSQLHPHFLFNTLNNLYALTVQKSDKAPETVERLSHMLDYILYKCNDSLVPLDKEVQLLENYIALEQLRYGDEIVITFSKEFREDTKIAPLVLLSIVENAFKHGASVSLDKPEIHIDLRQENEQLFFTVRNTKTENRRVNNNDSKGIGLTNLRQQLELLYQDFDCKITEEKEWFDVALRINTTKTYD
jgi:hypothetical protein